MAEKEVAIKLTIDGGKSVKNLQTVEEELTQIEKDLRNISKIDAVSKSEANFAALNKVVENSALSVQDMTKAMENYKSVAATAGRTSPIGKEALRRAGQLKDEIDGLSNEVNQLAKDGQNLQAAMQLGQGVIAGYTAFQGAIALVGVEDEKLMEVLTRLQAAQSVLMGVEQLRIVLEKESVLVSKLTAFWEGAKAKAVGISTKAKQKDIKVTGIITAVQWLWNAAVLANPIVAFAVAVVALTAGIIALSFATKEGTAEQQRANAVMETRNKLEKEAAAGIAEETSNLNSLISTVKRETASREDKNAAIKALQDQYPEYLGNITEEALLSGELNDLISMQTELIEARALAEAAAQAKKEAFSEQIALEIELAQDAEASWSEWSAAIVLGTDAQNVHNQTLKNNIATTKENISVIDELQQEYLETVDTLEGANLAMRSIQLGPSKEQLTKMKADFDKARDIAKKASQKRREDARKAAEAEAQAALEAQAFLDDLLIEVMVEGEDKRIAQRQSSFDSQIASLEAKGQLTAEITRTLTKQVEDDITRIQKEESLKRDALLTEDQKRRTDLRIELMKEGAEKEIAASNEIFKVRLELLEEQGLLDDETKVRLQEVQEEKIQAIRNKWADIAKQKNKEKNEALVADELASLGKASQAVETFGKINDSVTEAQLNKAGDDEKKKDQIRRKAFKREKALNIARALIAGAQAALQGIAKFGPPPSPGGIAALASAGAITAAQVAAIASAQFEGGGGGVNIPSTSITGGAGGGEGNVDTTTQTAGLTEAGAVEEAAPVKVFVSAVDMSNVQERTAKIDTIGTLD